MVLPLLVCTELFDVQKDALYKIILLSMLLNGLVSDLLSLRVKSNIIITITDFGNYGLFFVQPAFDPKRRQAL